MRVRQQHVDKNLRRKALQHLESIVESELAPIGSAKARILDEVCPIYRLDVEGVAYWEFEVDVAGRAGGASVLATPDLLRAQGSSQTLERLRPSAGPDGGAPTEGRGFIMVSTGEHDFPVPHWSLQRPPVSRQLEQMARAGKPVARVFKLDALAYVGEDEAGNEVARAGQTPVPIEGLSPDGQPGEIASMTAQPERSGKDEDADRLPHKVTRTGPKPPPIQHRDPMGWGRLKEQYAKAFAPALEGLGRQAAESWRVDKLVDEFGEGIIAGRPHKLALLHPDAAIALAGEGAPLVSATLIDRHGRPLVLLRAVEPPEGRETSFQLRVAYGNGEEEILNFFVVSKKTPSNVRAESMLKGGAL